MCLNFERTGGEVNIMVTYGKDSSMYLEYCSWPNWVLAQKRSRLHKGKRHDVQLFEANLEENLKEVRLIGLSPDYEVSPYTTKMIYEPKPRELYILPYNPDRIIQHAVLNVLMPYFMRMFEANSYSCIPGRGQTAAARKTMEYVRRYKWCYESDIRKCFPSINLDILSKMFYEKFRDEQFLTVNDKIIYSIRDNTERTTVVYTPDGQPYVVTLKKNCPIGNPLSQWYMNFYLNQWDLFLSHKLKLPHVRFCDNGNVYTNTLDEAKRAQEQIEKFYHKVLNLELSKSNIRRCEDGIQFVGYRCFPDGKMLVKKNTVKKQKKAIAKLPEMYESGLITMDEMRSTIDSILGWWKHAQTYHLKKSTKIMEIRDKYVATKLAA